MTIDTAVSERIVSSGRESFMEAVKVKDLSKTFRVRQKEKGMKGSIQAMFHPKITEIRAVDRVSFTVEQGEVLAFIGPNGAGKSTTIKMMTGILYPDSGSVEVLGRDPARKRKQLASEIGTVFGQKEQLWTHLTPYDNFRFFGAIYDLSDREAEARIRELSEVFELGSFLNTPVRNLSLGQRIRCEIVAAFIHKPKILFLDEPTIGLDPVVKENIRSLILQMNQELHTTIFLTSHDTLDIEKLCSRMIIVNAGQIVLDDSMEHVRRRYLSRQTAQGDLREERSLETVITEIYRAKGRVNQDL